MVVGSSEDKSRGGDENEAQTHHSQTEHLDGSEDDGVWGVGREFDCRLGFSRHRHHQSCVFDCFWGVEMGGLGGVRDGFLEI